MKLTKSLLLALVILLLAGVFFRMAGFAPQIAMAIFGAAVIRDKRLAFIFPLFTMFLSDIGIEIMYRNGWMDYGGFYAGLNMWDSQLMNYVLLALITFVGFWARNMHPGRIAAMTVSAPILFFIFSNFFVWMAGSGWARPKTLEGLFLCYGDGLPFLRTSLLATLVFSTILFGSYFLINRLLLQKKLA